ncbi:hypothetical protein GQ55_4G063000 [Panicum hallii var. hallii]|uniref:Uncharacterized protein n=1 Tax=Panicum hallii var. hallii TaxID=1504633 RepID=A0A2T7DVT7_9POAL|nr:hypothetical protein GQ55_4G063000 [Panicum hallii var. hallii]
MLRATHCTRSWSLCKRRTLEQRCSGHVMLWRQRLWGSSPATDECLFEGCALNVIHGVFMFGDLFVFGGNPCLKQSEAKT